MDFLDLDEWRTINVEKKNDDEYHVHAEPIRKPPICLSCGNFTEQRKDGRLRQVIFDLPNRKRKVGIYLNRQRYECLKCGKYYLESLPGVSDSHNATKRLIEHIGIEASVQTFTNLARETGYSISKVKSLFQEYADEQKEKCRFETPTILGIDEVYIKKKYYSVYANVGERTIFDMVEGRLEADVNTRLMKIEDYRRIRVVAMDMWDHYRTSIASCLPQAEIVVDVFHVVRGATEAFDTVRKSHRSKLTEEQRKSMLKDKDLLLLRAFRLKTEEKKTVKAYLDSYPRLKKAYQAKEEFSDIYQAGSEGKARKLYAQWLTNLDKDIRPAFEKLITSVTNWNKEIFNYFNHLGVTNAYTESLNGLIKLASKIGRGYKFEVLRAKMLLALNLHKKKSTGFDKAGLRERYADTFSTFIEQPRIINYGPDIALLIKEMEKGTF